MERLRVVGGAKLVGTVRVSGAKNSALKLMAATLLAPGQSKITNLPAIADVEYMAELLTRLGCQVDINRDSNEVLIDVPQKLGHRADYDMVRKMRASINVLGPLIARELVAEVALPGGDAIGSRGLDFHINGLTEMGAQVSSEHGFIIAKAPAGYGLDLRNVFGLVATLTEAEQGSLYKTEQINLFSTVPGVGVIINGARTQARNTADKFITVRRSLNFLKQTLKDSTAYALFEPNDERLWSDLTVKISSILTNFWGTGGLKGRSTGEAFYITCNSSNNTALSVEDGRVNIEVGVALQTPAEFIVITISQFTGGSTATAI